MGQKDEWNLLCWAHVDWIVVFIIGHIVAVDSVSPTVFVISEAGELMKWFDCSDYMREPSDIAISGKEYYVCDFKVCNLSNFSRTNIVKFHYSNPSILQAVSY